jgi:hypothetical protein
LYASINLVEIALEAAALDFAFVAIAFLDDGDQLVDLWSGEDRPRDIARVILSKLTKAKAERVAREILGLVKAVASHD